MDRGAWWARVHRVTKNQTQLTRLSTHSGQYKQIMEYSQSVSFLFRKCTRGKKRALCFTKSYKHGFRDIMFIS